jgi:hypothetical protein
MCLTLAFVFVANIQVGVTTVVAPHFARRGRLHCCITVLLVQHELLQVLDLEKTRGRERFLSDYGWTIACALRILRIHVKHREKPLVLQDCAFNS